ncbi:hypothetical protein CU098_002710 [Rhizopus stolonifer]|uniref:Uncharacterized protein n=1 Tax=Rhizopus stolonifer TaxID=4846 RepID=A0A367ITT4_RHIST|nr:hypothetical protein CU098_002710 [Rhizopus stolonifer]
MTLSNNQSQEIIKWKHVTTPAPEEVESEFGLDSETKPREIKAFKLKTKVTTNTRDTPGVPDSIPLDSSLETPSGLNSQLNHANDKRFTQFDQHMKFSTQIDRQEGHFSQLEQLMRNNQQLEAAIASASMRIC